MLKISCCQKTPTFQKGNEYNINIFSLLEKCTAFHFQNITSSLSEDQISKKEE